MLLFSMFGIAASLQACRLDLFQPPAAHLARKASCPAIKPVFQESGSISR